MILTHVTLTKFIASCSIVGPSILLNQGPLPKKQAQFIMGGHKTINKTRSHIFMLILIVVSIQVATSIKLQ